MKVYVDKLPENCGKCCFGDAFCCINNNYILDLVCLNKKSKDCPLQSLSDHTKQVRKEVVQEIKDLAGNYFELPICYNFGEASNDDVVLTGNDLTEILDQIQGETKC